MAKYRKKPIVVEAVRLPVIGEEPTDEVQEWLDKRPGKWECDRDEGIAIKTLEGVMRADPGDYVIEGALGELYPCKPDAFEASFEPA